MWAAQISTVGWKTTAPGPDTREGPGSTRSRSRRRDGVGHRLFAELTRLDAAWAGSLISGWQFSGDGDRCRCELRKGRGKIGAWLAWEAQLPMPRVMSSGYCHGIGIALLFPIVGNASPGG